MHKTWDGDFLGFPPGRSFVVLPASPPRSTLEGLALYDAVAIRQEAYVVVGRLLIRSGLGKVMSLQRREALPDPDWWSSWLTDIVEPEVGSVGSAAFRLLGEGSSEPDRFTCLLFDGKGKPLVFGKVWRGDGEDRDREELVLKVVEDLGAHTPRTFRVPELLHAGLHQGRSYLLQRPLPAGGHRRMKPDPVRLRAVIDELQSRLSPVLAPAPQPDLVPIHGSLTPLNLRVDRSGQLWLVDWDKTSWGPARYDEVRYWIGDLARRGIGSPTRRAGKVVQHLGHETTQELLARALEWRVAVRGPEVLAAEQQIRDALFALVGST